MEKKRGMEPRLIQTICISPSDVFRCLCKKVEGQIRGLQYEPSDQGSHSPQKELPNNPVHIQYIERMVEWVKLRSISFNLSNNMMNLNQYTHMMNSPSDKQYQNKYNTWNSNGAKPNCNSDQVLHMEESNLNRRQSVLAQHLRHTLTFQNSSRGYDNIQNIICQTLTNV